MHHVPDGILRRLIDEPLAVADQDAEHVRRCRRCQLHRELVIQDARMARDLMSRPQVVPDIDRAWERFGKTADHPVRHVPRRLRRRSTVVTAGAAAGVLTLAGAAAAATLSVVLSPTHVAPLAVSHGDLQALTAVLGVDSQGLWGSASASASGGATRRGPSPALGNKTWKYGTIEWSSPPRPVRTKSLKRAETTAGMAASLPSRLPRGAGGAPTFLALPPASVTVTFDGAAGPSIAGSVLTLHVGPGILAEYGGSGNGLGDAPTLAIVTMERPTATSSGVTTAELESFVLDRPGFPPDLAKEVRLLGELQTVLPIPVPPGLSETSATVAGSPGLVLSAGNGAVSAVVWEDRSGIVRTVGGLLDRKDVLDVARQLR